MEYIQGGIDLFFSDRFCFYRNIAAVIGVLYLAHLLLREICTLAVGFRAFFLAPWGISRLNLKKYGPWAVVTGASEGIGRGYSLELARQGLNVVIMSRSQEKLQKVADEIKEKYGREVRIIAVDFSKGQEVYPVIAEQLQDLDIGILVNNVGMSYEHPDTFANVPDDRLRNMVELNCQSPMQMTRLLLPKMVQRKRGIIVNISTGGTVRVPPMLHGYAASKSIVNFFSEGLHKEYTSKGIIVQTVAPFFVATAMSGLKRTNLIIAHPIAYTRAAVATIGIQSFTHGYFMHAVQGYVTSLVPEWIFDRITWNLLISAKQRYLRKKAKAQ